LAKLFLQLGEFLGCTYADRIIAISENIAKDIKYEYNKDAKVIYNGVSHIYISNKNTNSKLNELQIKEEKYILAVGRLVQVKGYHDLIDAFIILENNDSIINREKWKLVIVGKADFENNYTTKLINKSKNSKNIILTGFLVGKPLDELYRNAGIFVVSSYYEGQSIVLLEALSYGISCIATNIPGNKVLNMQEERLYQAGDVSGLTSKIEEFCNKRLSIKEKNNQIRDINHRFRWQKNAELTLELYKKICGQ